MGKTDQPLLAQIGSDALDDRVPLATTLRKCIALGAQARNDELRDWASKELDGYRDGGIPSYRTIHVPLKVDGLTFTHQVRGQQISRHELPDWAQDVISEELPLAQGVGDLQALVRNTTATGDKAVKMVPPGEMRATMPDDSSVPSPEQAASAVNVVLHGGKRSQFTVTTAVADNGASASVSTPPPAPQKEGGWTKTIAVWTVIIAIIAGITLYLTLK